MLSQHDLDGQWSHAALLSTRAFAVAPFVWMTVAISPFLASIELGLRGHLSFYWKRERNGCAN